MTGPIVAVVVAFLMSGTYNYAAADVTSLAECQQKVAEIARERLAANAKETDKVYAFVFKCVEFETLPAPAKKHVPGRDEA